MNFFKKLFAPKAKIEIGQTWRRKSENPFEICNVKVIDYKQNYVLYTYIKVNDVDIDPENQSLYSHKESSFRYLYKPIIEEDNDGE